MKSSSGWNILCLFLLPLYIISLEFPMFISNSTIMIPPFATLMLNSTTLSYNRRINIAAGMNGKFIGSSLKSLSTYKTWRESADCLVRVGFSAGLTLSRVCVELEGYLK